MSVNYKVCVIYGIRVRKEDYPQFYYSDMQEEIKEDYPEKFEDLKVSEQYDDYYGGKLGDFTINEARKQRSDSDYFYIGKLMFKGDAIYGFDNEITFLETDTKYFIYENIRDKFGIDLVKDDIEAEIKLWIIPEYN